ncbi:MAG TPA: hypothetical protein DDW42_03635 [Desulfobacteraceae bacterium]|nr:hypothetical protein [Desulfobacteraceae bacterium]
MKEKILVVDNHPIMLKFMIDLLAKKGYQIKTAQDGLSALDTLKEYIPDIIFMDLIMPNISGDKLCRIVRTTAGLEHVYIIIVSAIAAEQEVDWAKFGADACLAKGPLDKMGRYVLSALEQFHQGNIGDLPKKVIGHEGLRKRVITKELLISKRHFEHILNNMSEGILEFSPGAIIVYANPVAISLIGIPEERLLGSSFFRFFSEKDRDRVKDLVKHHEKRPQAITEDSPVALNGKEISLNVLRIMNEENESIIAIMNDVSERRRIRSQVQAAQKMEALGTLAGGIAHNFNNLLMGIQGNTSLILLDVLDTHPYYKYLKNIEKQVQSGSRLTTQLLGYARAGKYEVRQIDLNKLVVQSSETFGRTKKEIVITHDLADDLSGINADQGQIEQVLWNLYINAWQAMPGGGELFIKTRNISYEDMKGKSYKPKAVRYVLLKIADTGVGMDKKTQERIFDPFFTTKQMGRGTGLGLASAYGVIKGHGGYIDVVSAKGKGTSFSIYLPVSEDEKIEEIIEERDLSENFIKGSGTVLLVDDEDMIIDIGSQMLKAIGYNTLVAMSGKEAVDIYRKNRGKIDLVILDMIMPGIGGGKTYDQLKEFDPDIKVILSSGYSINGQATEIIKRGCNGFIQKPFSIKELSSKIGEVLQMYRLNK